MLIYPEGYAYAHFFPKTSKVTMARVGDVFLVGAKTKITELQPGWEYVYKRARFVCKKIEECSCPYCKGEVMLSYFSYNNTYWNAECINPECAALWPMRREFSETLADTKTTAINKGPLP